MRRRPPGTCVYARVLLAIAVIAIAVPSYAQRQQSRKTTAPPRSTGGFSFGLLIDTSGPAWGTRGMERGLMHFVHSLRDQQDEAFVIDYGVEPILEQDLTSNPDFIRRAVQTKRTKGRSLLYDAVIESANHMARIARYSRKVLFVLADRPDDGSKGSVYEVAATLREAPGLTVYLLGVGVDANFAETLTALANRVHATAYFIPMDNFELYFDRIVDLVYAGAKLPTVETARVERGPNMPQADESAEATIPGYKPQSQISSGTSEVQAPPRSVAKDAYTHPVSTAALSPIIGPQVQLARGDQPLSGYDEVVVGEFLVAPNALQVLAGQGELLPRLLVGNLRNSGSFRHVLSGSEAIAPAQPPTLPADLIGRRLLLSGTVTAAAAQTGRLARQGSVPALIISCVFLDARTGRTVLTLQRTLTLPSTTTQQIQVAMMKFAGSLVQEIGRNR